MNTRAIVIPATLLILHLGAPTIAQQTSNFEIPAVPAPGPVTIDGGLDDWDLSGGILMCYDLETLLDTHSVRASLMYDEAFLYAATVSEYKGCYR